MGGFNVSGGMRLSKKTREVKRSECDFGITGFSSINVGWGLRFHSP